MFKLKKDEEADLEQRLIRRSDYFKISICVLFGLLILQLFSMQVLNTDAYSSVASSNQIRTISETAKRGEIVDTNGVALATSRVDFTISISTTDVSSENRQQLAENLAAILNDPEITAEVIYEKITTNYRSYVPVVITSLPYEENLEMISILEENRINLPGLIIMQEPYRIYPLEETAGHILGYVGLISDPDKELQEYYGYLSTDMVGKTGLEKTMERFVNELGEEIGLRGERGTTLLEVDSSNRIVSTVEEVAAIPGNSMVLTVDSHIQQVMEESLAETIATISETREKCQAGAGVLIDVKTGGIIAMASYPEMNPNDFMDGLSTEEVEYYYDETLRPSFNRAVGGAYPIGSTFKASTALAALAAGTVDADTEIFCDPSNWTIEKAACTSAHGWVNMSEAMACSCNTYFQDIAVMTGMEQMNEVFAQLGYGQLTGIEITGEVQGLLADAEWKAENYEGRDGTWFPYDTNFMAIGQGYSYYTPLQVANAVATIANDGVRMQNYIVAQIYNADGELEYEKEPTIVDTIDIDQESMDVLKNALEAVTSEGGTGYGLFGNYPIKVAAKTGTAQTGLVGDDKNSDYHGWFIAYAPADDPQVAFAGIIEYGYHGSTSAGYVCKDVFDAYFGYDTGYVVVTNPVE